MLPSRSINIFLGNEKFISAGYHRELISRRKYYYFKNIYSYPGREMKVLHVPVADFGNPLLLLFLPCPVSVSALDVSSQVHRRQTGAAKRL